jgi:hypothetical protein
MVKIAYGGGTPPAHSILHHRPPHRHGSRCARPAPPLPRHTAGERKGSLLREPSLHLLDFRPLSRDDLFGELLHLSVFAELKHDF